MTDKKEKPKRTVNPNLRPPWKKGQSGKPEGRPTRDMQCRELLAQIGEHGDEALDIIAEVMRNPRAGHAEKIKLKAANSILDRIVGKPTQSLATSVIQRTVAADGTLIEGSAMMSPLLQAAQAHFVEEEMRKLAAPKTEPEPEPSPPPSLPSPSRYLTNPSHRLNPSRQSNHAAPLCADTRGARAGSRGPPPPSPQTALFRHTCRRRCLHGLEGERTRGTSRKNGASSSRAAKSPLRTGFNLIRRKAPRSSALPASLVVEVFAAVEKSLRHEGI